MLPLPLASLSQGHDERWDQRFSFSFSFLGGRPESQIKTSRITRVPGIHIHPWRLTWNIIMEVWKIIFLSKWVIGKFHVNLPGCIQENYNIPLEHTQSAIPCSPTMKGIPAYSLLVKVARGCVPKVCWNNLRIYRHVSFGSGSDIICSYNICEYKLYRIYV